jgi:hypothetical protein
MNKHSEVMIPNPFRLTESRKKIEMNSRKEETFDRARESALLMLARLSLSKTVAQIKKQ